MTAPAIHIQNVSLSYQDTPVFTNLNLNLRAGKWTALLGTSGVGKSSLLRLIAGLTTADEFSAGSITADNNVAVSQQIAWMAQTDMLLPWLCVLDNLLLGMRLRGNVSSRAVIPSGFWRGIQKLNSAESCVVKALGPAPKAARDDAFVKARALLSQAGLAHAENFYPHQLSGGMRQRVALLRTLMEDKPVVLMDEPFSALDTMTRYHLHQLAVELLRDKTVLFVTHDPAEALRLADDVYLLTSDGLQHLACLESLAPRAPHEPELVHLQAEIYARLLQTVEVAV